jgi:hypothetical protein
MTATVIPLRRPPPPEARALAALLGAISDPQLRDYCVAQLRAADTPEEASAALALAVALARPAPEGEPEPMSEPVLRVATGGAARPVLVPADIGQGPATPVRGTLSAQRKGKRPCIATSSSQ